MNMASNCYDVLRTKIISEDNQDAIRLMNRLDDIEIKSDDTSESEIREIHNGILGLEINEIHRGLLLRKCKILQKRIERVVPKSFGSYIRYLRKTHGYSLKDIELEVGISASYINRIEMGKRKNISYPIMSKLSQIFNVPLTQMLSAASTENVPDVVDLLAANPFSFDGHILEDSEKELLVELFIMMFDIMDKMNNFKGMLGNVQIEEERQIKSSQLVR